MNSKITRIGVRATIALIFFGASYASSALENITFEDGVTACYNWCDAHNQTSSSRLKCKDACLVYWACNASNSTPQMCDDAKYVTGISEATQGNNTPSPSQTTPPQVNPVVNRAPSAGTAALPSTSTSTPTSSVTTRAATTAASSTLIK